MEISYRRIVPENCSCRISTCGETSLFLCTPPAVLDGQMMVCSFALAMGCPSRTLQAGRGLRQGNRENLRRVNRACKKAIKLILLKVH